MDNSIIIFNIIKYLEVDDIHSTELVSKQWYKQSNNNKLWEILILKKILNIDDYLNEDIDIYSKGLLNLDLGEINTKELFKKCFPYHFKRVSNLNYLKLYGLINNTGDCIPNIDFTINEIKNSFQKNLKQNSDTTINTLENENKNENENEKNKEKEKNDAKNEKDSDKNDEEDKSIESFIDNIRFRINSLISSFKHNQSKEIEIDSKHKILPKFFMLTSHNFNEISNEKTYSFYEMDILTFLIIIPKLVNVETTATTTTSFIDGQPKQSSQTTNIQYSKFLKVTYSFGKFYDLEDNCPNYDNEYFGELLGFNNIFKFIDLDNPKHFSCINEISSKVPIFSDFKTICSENESELDFDDKGDGKKVKISKIGFSRYQNYKKYTILESKVNKIQEFIGDSFQFKIDKNTDLYSHPFYSFIENEFLQLDGEGKKLFDFDKFLKLGKQDQIINRDQYPYFSSIDSMLVSLKNKQAKKQLIGRGNKRGRDKDFIKVDYDIKKVLKSLDLKLNILESIYNSEDLEDNYDSDDGDKDDAGDGKYETFKSNIEKLVILHRHGESVCNTYQPSKINSFTLLLSIPTINNNKQNIQDNLIVYVYFFAHYFDKYSTSLDNPLRKFKILYIYESDLKPYELNGGNGSSISGHSLINPSSLLNLYSWGNNRGTITEIYDKNSLLLNANEIEKKKIENNELAFFEKLSFIIDTLLPNIGNSFLLSVLFWSDLTKFLSDDPKHLHPKATQIENSKLDFRCSSDYFLHLSLYKHEMDLK